MRELTRDEANKRAVSAETVAEASMVGDECANESAALSIISYHGAPWSGNGVPFLADLTEADVRKIVQLLDRAARVLALLGVKEEG